MKIHIEVDCTPEEARRFLGLPDVGPMQATLIEMLQERLTEAMRATDARTLLEQWLPLGIKGLEQWQSFWTQLAGAASAAAAVKTPPGGASGPGMGTSTSPPPGGKTSPRKG
jgi:hypothetical protein